MSPIFFFKAKILKYKVKMLLTRREQKEKRKTKGKKEKTMHTRGTKFILLELASDVFKSSEKIYFLYYFLQQY